ncbi:MAG: hypothetical protein ACXADB_01730 [Candidatus Hermodarchaeia archaeon]|jgi:hypothetical protein
MRRTLSLKLVDPPQDELRRTMSVFRDACEILSAMIQQGAPINRGRLHRRFYKFLRQKYNLPSQMTQSAIRVVVGAYRSKRANGNKGSVPRFQRPQVQYQYNRDWSFSKGRVSLRTLVARRYIHFHIGRYQQKKYFKDKDWSFGGARLVERKGIFFLNISLYKKSIQQHKPITPIGIDRGIRCLVAARALGKTPLIVRGGKLADYRGRMVRLRRRLKSGIMRNGIQ